MRQSAVRDTEVSFVCVGTPSAANGSQDLTAILRLAEQIGAALRSQARLPHHRHPLDGAAGNSGGEARAHPRARERQALRRRFRAVRSSRSSCAKAAPIRDYDHPPYTIVGGNCEAAVNAVREIFQHLDARFLVTNIRVAESAQDELQRVSCAQDHVRQRDRPRLRSRSASIRTKSCGWCAPTRGSTSRPAYLKPGFAFGGSCLPKDLRALTQIAKQNDSRFPMLASLLASNRVHIDHAVDKILKLGRPRVGMLGLSFKTGTDDLRESPLVMVAKRLIGEGCELRIFDPEVHLSRLLGANRSYIDAHIPHLGSLLCDDIEEMIDPSEVILVGLQQPALDSALQARVRPDQYLIDLVNLPNRDLLLSYEGICW